MGFQHYKSHGLTEVRVRLSGQHQSCPSPVLGLGGLWGTLGSWHWGGDWWSLGQDALGRELDSWNSNPVLPVFIGSWHGQSRALHGQPVLTATPRRLLCLLLGNPGKIVKRAKC